jgi:hypothetical protein
MKRFLLTLIAVAALSSCSEKKFDCKGAQSAVHAQLRKAQVSMMEAGAMSMKYPIDIKVLVDKHRLKLEPGNYDIRIASADTDRFVIEARGTGEMSGDVWRIDEKGEVTAQSEKKCP